MTALSETLTHEIPLFADVPLATLMRIRHDEQPAFASYRDSLTRILRDHLAKGGDVSVADAREIHSDILRPEINRLKAKADEEKRSRRSRAILKGIVPAALITVGMYGGFLPNQWADILKVVGGFGLARDFAESGGSGGRRIGS
jgi:hypothetical protein